MKILTLCLTGLLLFSACSKSKVEGCMDPLAVNYNPDAEESATCSYTTQEQLDASRTPLDVDVVGDPYNGFTDDPTTKNSRLRSSFYLPNGVEPYSQGAMYTRHVYYYDAAQGKNHDSLINVAVMIKRHKGYYPAGGDWEYINIPRSASTDYAQHPNGMLPEVTDSVHRGRITKCATCHALAPGNDFVFVER